MMSRKQLLYRNWLVVATVAVWFWAGVVAAKFVHAELKDVIDLGIAVGTIGAVVVALWQIMRSQRESRSLAYREAATEHLRQSLRLFLSKRDAQGRPYNSRRHWLEFARALAVSRRMGDRIELSEQREIWVEQEHAFRLELYDVLDPIVDSYPKDYYLGPPSVPGKLNELEISEASLTVVYRWVVWPDGLADPIDKKAKFTDDEMEKMRTFGPRGLAEFIDLPLPKRSAEVLIEPHKP